MKIEANRTSGRQARRHARSGSGRDHSELPQATPSERRGTERRQADRRGDRSRHEDHEAQAREVELRESLAQMMVHDLRTPLTSILVGLQAAGCLSEMSPAQRKCIGIAISGGQELLGMVNDLLDIPRLESEALRLNLSLLDAQSLISSALSQVSPLAERKRLSVRVEVEDGATAWGDEEKLVRVLVNLLGNAIKFTPRGGQVSVHARCDQPGALALWVSDTGEGIPEASLGTIFDKFAQVEERQAGRTSSTGLGLTFCKLAVEAHGGTIRVESALGRGSTFTITLPAEAESNFSPH